MTDETTKNKAQAVRDYIKKHRNAKPQEIAKALTDQNIQVNSSYVSKIKSMQLSKKKPKQKSSTKVKTIQGRGQAWTFPKHTLEDSIRIPKSIEEKNAGNPMRASDLVKAVGFRQPKDWRFLDLLRSSNQYGLTSGAGEKATIRIEKIGQGIIAPSSPKERQKSLLEAFNNVPDFKAVAEFYGDKKIPEDEFFLNTLTREFKIPRDRVEAFAEIFVSNLEYLRAFDVVKQDTEIISVSGDTNSEKEIEKLPIEKRVSKQPRVREFLDTCFVMMPFGNWFDRYYQEIYVPAIREAGFEPIRADELFSTGTVVEQIWEQIKKSKVLIADLTGRNPNVFYELGLAHAAKKPVIFTAPIVEDVPFDLRHLRVIIYEIREPGWDTTLRSNVTEFIKNALKEPEKSIPHPFRGELEE